MCDRALEVSKVYDRGCQCSGGEKQGQGNDGRGKSRDFMFTVLRVGV